MWGKEGRYHYLLFYRKYLGSKWISQRSITSSWWSLGENSGCPTPSTFLSIGKTWNEAVGFQGAWNAGILIPLSPLSWRSYDSRRTQGILLFLVQDSSALYHSRNKRLSNSNSDFLNAWPWGHIQNEAPSIKELGAYGDNYPENRNGPYNLLSYCEVAGVRSY